MEAIEFACVISEITKSLKIDIDSDIVGNIFDIYQGSYENYTLFELLHLLRKGNHEITVPWNKKAIIKMIEDKKIAIPRKYEDMEPTKWEHYRIRKSLEVINIIGSYMEFDDNGFNIFQDSRGNIHKLECICRELDENEEENLAMYFENIVNNQTSRLQVEDFIWSLDNEDITILQYVLHEKFLNEEEKERWKNHIRYI
jgi:hypothetical protein